MRIRPPYLRGNVLPTVIAVSVVILTGLACLLSLWSWESLLFARNEHLRRVRADAESAYLLYSLHPDRIPTGRSYSLYDSMPLAQVHIGVENWGLYEIVRVTPSDSSQRFCRILGAEPESRKTLFYADNRSSLTLAGETVLHGELSLPRQGILYGRIGSDFFSGEEIPQASIRSSEAVLTAPDREITARIEGLFTGAGSKMEFLSSDTLYRSFIRDSTACYQLGDVRLEDCRFSGNIVLYGGEVHIGPLCRMEQVVLCVRKAVVESGAHISAQIFARDTVLIGTGVRMAYPSGIYTQGYAEVGEKAEINGYAIVRDTVHRKKISANYRQARTARLRGLLWVEGAAQVQGIVTGRMYLRQAVFFSPQGYYKDFLYDATLLENPLTALPLWPAKGSVRRKETVCVD